LAEAPCAAASFSLGEPVYATASIVHSWVLLEQPGPWGRDALIQSRLPAELALEMQERADRHGVRLLLLRRAVPGRVSAPTCFVAHSGRHAPWIERATLDDAQQLLDLDFAALATGERPGFGEPHAEALYLVCTNGRHDPCCARLGRPVIRALLPSVGGAVWECSHVGGDRFAGNLVCLPHGLYFGRLGPVEAQRVVERYREGVIELDHYRGRAGDPYAVQAAEFFLRRAAGLAGVDDVVPTGSRKLRPREVEVDFRALHGRRHRVVVAVAPATDPRPLTCTAVQAQRPPTYSLLGMAPI
jgi:hypothetical protein